MVAGFQKLRPCFRVESPPQGAEQAERIGSGESGGGFDVPASVGVIGDGNARLIDGAVGGINPANCLLKMFT